MFDPKDPKGQNAPQTPPAAKDAVPPLERRERPESSSIDPSAAAQALVEAESDILDAIEFASSALGPSAEPPQRFPEQEHPEFSLEDDFVFPFPQEEDAKKEGASSEEPPLPDPLADLVSEWEAEESLVPPGLIPEPPPLDVLDEHSSFSGFEDAPSEDYMTGALPLYVPINEPAPELPPAPPPSPPPYVGEGEEELEEDDSDEFDLAAVTQALSDTGAAPPEVSSEAAAPPQEASEAAAIAPLPNIEEALLGQQSEEEDLPWLAESAPPAPSLLEEEAPPLEEPSFAAPVSELAPVDKKEEAPAAAPLPAPEAPDQELRDMLGLPPPVEAKGEEGLVLPVPEPEEEDLSGGWGAEEDTKILSLDDIVVLPVSSAQKEAKESEKKSPSALTPPPIPKAPTPPPPVPKAPVPPPPVPKAPAPPPPVPPSAEATGAGAKEEAEEGPLPLFSGWVSPLPEPLPEEALGRPEGRWLTILSTEVAAREERRAELLYEAGELYETAFSRSEDALACFRASLQQDPGFEPALHGLIRLLGQEHNWDEVLTRLGEKKETDGARRAWLELERALILEGTLHDDARARLSYRMALDASPGFLGSLLALSRLARMRGDFREAAKLWEETARVIKDPRWQGAILFELAQLRERSLGDADGAIEALKQALAAEPGVGGYLRELARLAIWQGRFPELLWALEKERAGASPEEAAAILRLMSTTLLYRQGDAEGAWARLEEALSLVQGDFALLEAAARVAERIGRRAEERALKHQLIDLVSHEESRQVLVLDLALTFLQGEAEPFDGKVRDLLIQAAKGGKYAQEAVRLATRLARRVGDRAAERALFVERRDAVAGDPFLVAEANLILARLTEEPQEAEKRFQGALEGESSALDAALALADRGFGIGDSFLALDALSRAASYARGKEEAEILGLRRAAIARFRVKDPGRYADAISALVERECVSPGELALALEAANRPAEAASVLEQLLAKASDVGAGAERAYLLHLARLREDSGDKESARALYLRLEEASPGDLQALLGLERCGAEERVLAAVSERAADTRSVKEERLALWHRAAALYLRLGDTAGAARVYERILALRPEDEIAVLGLVALAQMKGDSQLLGATLAQGALQESELGDVLALWSGLTQEAQGDLDGAALTYRQAFSGGGQASEIARRLALDLEARRGDWGEVETLAAQSFEDVSEKTRARRRQLRLELASAFETKDPARAREYYEGVLAEAPKDVVALRGLLRTSLLEGDSAGAVAASERLASVLGVPALSAAARLRAARLLAEEGGEGALDHLSVALAMSRTDPRVLFSVEAQRGRGATRSDLRAAYEARLATALPEERPVYLMRLGELEAQFGRPGDALPILEVARERSPENVGVLLAYRRATRAAGEQGGFTRASEALAAQLKTPRLAAKVLREAALKEEAAGRRSSAEALCAQALKRYPQDRESLFLQSRLLAERGADEALIYLLTEHREAEESPKLLVELGLALRRQKRPAEARRTLIKVIALEPGNIAALNALYELALETGRFDEAVEVARRLLKRAQEGAPKAEAAKRLGEALLHTPQKAEALVHFQTYLRLNPEDEELTERFLSLTKELGRLREGVLYLDGRYQAEKEITKKRKIAERLGRFFEESDPPQPSQAGEWYAKALGQDPLGAECGSRLVSLWKGRGEERRLLALLEGVHLVLAEKLQEDPGRWEIYQRLAELFSWRGNQARYYAVRDLARAVRLDRELPLPSTPLPPPGPPVRALSEEEQRLLAPKTALLPGRSALLSIREILPRAFGRAPSDLGLGRRERLRDGERLARRREVESLAGLFGLKISEAYVGGEPGRCMVLQSGSELFAIVGAGLLEKPLPPEARFDLGRAFAMARVGLLPLLDASGETLEGCLRGMTWWADERLRERELSPESARAARAVYDSMTRGLRKSLAEQFQALAQNFPKDLETLAAGLIEEADRGGLLAAGSLLGPLGRFADLSFLQGAGALRTLLSTPRAIALVQYALSKEYEELVLALSAA